MWAAAHGPSPISTPLGLTPPRPGDSARAASPRDTRDHTRLPWGYARVGDHASRPPLFSRRRSRSRSREPPHTRHIRPIWRDADQLGEPARGRRGPAETHAPRQVGRSRSRSREPRRVVPMLGRPGLEAAPLPRERGYSATSRGDYPQLPVRFNRSRSREPPSHTRTIHWNQREGPGEAARQTPAPLPDERLRASDQAHAPWEEACPAPTRVEDQTQPQPLPQDVVMGNSGDAERKAPPLPLSRTRKRRPMRS